MDDCAVCDAGNPAVGRRQQGSRACVAQIRIVEYERRYRTRVGKFRRHYHRASLRAPEKGSVSAVGKERDGSRPGGFQRRHAIDDDLWIAVKFGSDPLGKVAKSKSQCAASATRRISRRIL